MRIPRPTLLAILVFINFATAGIGTPLTGPEGKLALSNLTPILFIAFAAVPFLANIRGIPAKFLCYLLLFNIGCLASFAIFMARFGWVPDILVLLFQDVEIIFCALLVLYAKDNWLEFRTVVRAGIYASVPITLLLGYRDHLNGTLPLQFGMDDKSQAAVFLCMEAFILVRFYRRPLDAIVGLGLLGVSLLTVSRLPAFFVPAILTSIAVRSAFGFAFVALLSCTAIGVFITYSDLVLKIFVALDRLTSSDALGSNSTLSHLTLLRSALRMKFTDPLAFIFGTGPGNFSKALTTFHPPEIQTLEFIDPKLLNEAYFGKTPLHSTPLQLLLDYSLPTFLLCIYGIYKVLARLASAFTLADWLFAGGLFGSAMFYSLHDKHYFFLLGITVVLFITRRADQLQLKERNSHAPVAPPIVRSGLQPT